MTNKRQPQPKGIKGILEPFCETGTEGIIWSLQDVKHISPNGQWSYDGLNCLEDGDFLKVFNDAARRKVLWQGVIKMKHPPATEFNRGIQDGVNEQEWAKMFFDAKPGLLYRKDDYAKVKAEALRRGDAAKERRRKVSEAMQACREGIDVKPMKPLRLKPKT